MTAPISYGTSLLKGERLEPTFSTTERECLAFAPNNRVGIMVLDYKVVLPGYQLTAHTLMEEDVDLPR